MDKLKELEMPEMIEISGGINPAYEIGFALGSSFRHAILFFEAYMLFK
ncbi:MAG: hypothetical protein IPJ37_05885 [Bacteroidales bacterium]|nr:hypothetical protein [Bacteroidales bacterium]